VWAYLLVRSIQHVRISHLMWLVAVAPLLVGCATRADKPATVAGATAAISAEQARELTDHSVSHDEYMAAFRRYQNCMLKAGFDIVVLGEKGRVLDLRLTQAAAESTAQDHCYPYEFEQVDTAWQLQNEDYSESAAILGNCLRAHGLPVPTTKREKHEALKAAGIDTDTCY
jgi:hypothetical protein